DKTRLLLNSKYNGDVEARTQIMDDLLDTIRREIPGGATRTDYICYAAANGSGIEHARFLAAMLADNIGADLCAPSRVPQIPAGSRVLLFDDVFATGRTLRALAEQVPEDCDVKALVYLMARKGPGIGTDERNAA